MHKILDLFSGLGGFSLGLERTGCFKTIAFCDNDKFSKLILDKHWKGVKVYNDVREITKERFIADGIQFPYIITGGFPCQPFSVAGKQKGTSDDRHLWPEMFRIIKAFKPRYVIGENVRGIINIQDGVVFETVCTDLESEGYEVQPFIIPAAGVGAPHRRERVWIVAVREEDEVGEGYANQHQRSGSSSEFDVANANSERPQGHGEEYELRKDSQEIKTSGSSSSARETVANTYTRLSNGSFEEIQSRGQAPNSSSKGSTNVANTESSIRDDFQAVAGDGKSSTQEIFGDGSSVSGESTWWHTEPNVGRVAHGVPGRVHRLKGLGNSIVPQIAEEIGRAIIKAEKKGGYYE